MVPTAICLAALALAACAPRAEAPVPSAVVPVALDLEAAERLVIMVPEEDPIERRRLIEAIARDHPITVVERGPFAAIGMYGVVCEVDEGHSVANVYDELRADQRIALVQPLQHFRLQLLHYDDQLLDAQENLRAIDLLPAHAVARGRGVRVAVVDSAVDRTHPDLEGGIAERRDFIVPSEGDRVAERHGTAVAGVIGARGGNRVGIVGVAPEVDIVALRGCSEQDPAAIGCSSFTLGRALDYAILARVDVINLSLEGPFDPLLARLIERAVAENTIVVASKSAAGSFPASLPGVIAVAASGTPMQATAVAAPGSDVLTTVPGAAYDFLTGSSLAAAHVTGLAALLRELDPELDAARLNALLVGERDASQPETVVADVDACVTVRALLSDNGNPAAEELHCRR